MHTFETIEVSTDGPVATITLNRPAKLNAISGGLRSDVAAALEYFNAGSAIRVIRLRGNGRIFSAGYDLEGGYLTSEVGEGDDPAPEHAQSSVWRDVDDLHGVADWLRAIRRYRKPIVAQIHGMCLSGGMDLIGACDIVIAARGTKIGHPAARALGIPVSLGMLPYRIGQLRTKHLLFTGDTIDADVAAQWGLVNEVVEQPELDDHVARYCARIALEPLDMLTLHKTVTNRWFELMGMDAAISAGVELDAIAHTSAFGAEFKRIAHAEGLKAALTWRDAPFAAPVSDGSDPASDEPRSRPDGERAADEV